MEDVDPIASYYASVSRKLADGSVFFGDQRMTRVEALRSYTVNAAYAAFEEDIKGSLGPGKLADITVLSQDILTISEELIPETVVLYTINELELCREAVKEFDLLAGATEGCLRCLWCDLDENPVTRDVMAIEGVPAVVVYRERDAEELDRWIGASTFETMMARLKKRLTLKPPNDPR